MHSDVRPSAAVELGAPVGGVALGDRPGEAAGAVLLAAGTLQVLAGLYRPEPGIPAGLLLGALHLLVGAGLTLLPWRRWGDALQVTVPPGVFVAAGAAGILVGAPFGVQAIIVVLGTLWIGLFLRPWILVGAFPAGLALLVPTSGPAGTLSGALLDAGAVVAGGIVGGLLLASSLGRVPAFHVAPGPRGAGYRTERSSPAAGRAEPLGVLTARMAQELNNLLTVIHCNVEVLRDSIAEERRGARECLEDARVAARRAGEVVHWLFDFTEGGGLAVEEPFDPDEGWAPATAPPTRILLVEDEEPDRRALQRLLERLGHSVTTAADGQEALELYQESEGVELVISDLRMPVLDGMDLYRRLRMLDAEVPFLLTSADERAPRDVIPSEGSVPFLPKPWDLDELSRLVVELRREG